MFTFVKFARPLGGNWAAVVTQAGVGVDWVWTLAELLERRALVAGAPDESAIRQLMATDAAITAEQKAREAAQAAAQTAQTAADNARAQAQADEIVNRPFLDILADQARSTLNPGGIVDAILPTGKVARVIAIGGVVLGLGLAVKLLGKGNDR